MNAVVYQFQARPRAPGATWRTVAVFYALAYAEQFALDMQTHDDSSDYRVCAV